MSESFRFEELASRSHYCLDGRMRPFFREWCLKEGLTAEDIRKMEEIEREEREFRQRLLRANAGGIKQTRRDRIRSREGLTPQELMSEGYLQPDDFDYALAHTTTTAQA